MPTWESASAGWNNLWPAAKIAPGRENEVRTAVNFLLAHKAKFKAVEAETGVPWHWIAATYLREAGRDASFKRVLHNGEKIIGTGRKTRLVPAGRGPFGSWHEAAIDALRMKSLHRVADWTPARWGFEHERWNGFGYVGRIRTPFVFAATTLQQRGKFVADHVFDPKHSDKQLGTYSVLRGLIDADSEVRAWAGGDTPDVPPSTKDDDLTQRFKRLLAAAPEGADVSVTISLTKGLRPRSDSPTNSATVKENDMNELLKMLADLIFNRSLGPVDNWKTWLGIMLWAGGLAASYFGVEPMNPGGLLEYLVNAFLGGEIGGVVTAIGLAHKAGKVK